jgi:20S proteasome subunit beta 7
LDEYATTHIHTDINVSYRVQEHCADDGHVLGTPHIYEYLWRVMYQRRSKFNPLWNSLVVGGINKGEKFLGYVDLRGTTYQSTTIATGFGAHLAQPILRRRVEGREDELTEEEAIEIMNECLKVLFYRDARSMNKVNTAHTHTLDLCIDVYLIVPKSKDHRKWFRDH